MPSSINNFRVLLEKETRENLRTKRLLVMACVFVFFAITSPLLARYMGEFFDLLMRTDDAAVAAVASMFPDPTWRDSYVQFYGNIAQTGAIVIIFMFMGLILREKRTGTADLIFCKGVLPAPFVLAKFTVASVLSLLCLLAAILINYGYTVMLFDYGGQMRHVLAGAGAMGMFLLMTIAWVIFASTLAKSTAIAAVLGFLGFIAMIGVSAIPRIGRFLPGHLITRNVVITMGEYYPDFGVHLAVATGITVLLLLGSIMLLKKQEL